MNWHLVHVCTSGTHEHAMEKNHLDRRLGCVEHLLEYQGVCSTFAGISRGWYIHWNIKGV